LAALGFYGDAIQVGHGSLGGWDPFGPDRLITDRKATCFTNWTASRPWRCTRTYLGDHAAGLPATGLLFPLALTTATGRDWRTGAHHPGRDEEDQSMTFAGDMPEGMYARLMKANFDRLVDGAASAAEAAKTAPFPDGDPELAILISCVGRKLVLKQRIEEEVEAVRDVLGKEPRSPAFIPTARFRPMPPTARCELHNQTMTITTLSET
jgi:hypothetical protein